MWPTVYQSGMPFGIAIRYRSKKLTRKSENYLLNFLRPTIKITQPTKEGGRLSERDSLESVDAYFITSYCNGGDQQPSTQRSSVPCLEARVSCLLFHKRNSTEDLKFNLAPSRGFYHGSCSTKPSVLCFLLPRCHSSKKIPQIHKGSVKS